MLAWVYVYYVCARVCAYIPLESLADKQYVYTLAVAFFMYNKKKIIINCNILNKTGSVIPFVLRERLDGLYGGWLTISISYIHNIIVQTHVYLYIYSLSYIFFSKYAVYSRYNASFDTRITHT